MAQRIPNPNHDFFLLNLSLGLILCQTSSEAGLCNHACSFTIIFRADLFLIDWGPLGPSPALSQSGQPAWQPSKDHACPEVPLPASPDWRHRPGLRRPLFCHSGLFFLGLGWLSRNYWMLCRVEAPSCTVYIGNGVHPSGRAEGVGRVTHKSVLSAS